MVNPAPPVTPPAALRRFRLQRRAGGDERVDLLTVEAPVGERRARVLAGSGRRAGECAGCAREAGCGGGLVDAVACGERAPRCHMRVGRCFLQGQHGRETGIGAFQQRAPFLARLREEEPPEALGQLRPAGPVHAFRQHLAVEAGQAEEGVVELGLDGAECHPLAVRGLIAAVEGRAAVDQVRLALVAPPAGGREPLHEGHQRGGAIDDRSIDHLSLSGGAAFEQRRQYAEGGVERTAAEIAGKVERRRGRSRRRADGVQRTGQRQIIEVVARRARERAGLPPAGQPRIDEAGITREQGFRPEPQPFHHAGAKALQQHIGAFGEREHRFDSAGLLEVERGRAPAPVQQVGARMDAVGWPHPVDAQHIRAHVGQQHGAMRPRPDARNLQHPEPGKRPGCAHAAVLVCRQLAASPLTQVKGDQHTKPECHHRHPKIPRFVSMNIAEREFSQSDMTNNSYSVLPKIYFIFQSVHQPWLKAYYEAHSSPNLSQIPPHYCQTLGDSFCESILRSRPQFARHSCVLSHDEFRHLPI